MATQAEIRTEWESLIRAEDRIPEEVPESEWLLYLSERVHNWWANPLPYTGRKLETTPRRRPKLKQGELNLGEVEEPATYETLKKRNRPKGSVYNVD